MIDLNVAYNFPKEAVVWKLYRKVQREIPLHVDEVGYALEYLDQHPSWAFINNPELTLKYVSQTIGFLR